ncbi:hypothetical protein LJR290_001581 [Variovorax sp. LjRoot290]|uniref:hypothetical protein n=1 Tax=unclassified Variovorax TaxID=663243 RepID=UPI003ECE3FA3
MEPMHWEYIGALGGVIGIGWLVVVPMYRGWKPLNKRMTDRVRETTTLLAALECDHAGRSSRRLPASRCCPTSIR